MHWTPSVYLFCHFVSICVAISFESTVIATNNLSSLTALPASASQSCGGCNINEHVFQFDWYSEVFTHIAATVVKFVNNATNITRTSTIRGSDFVLPSSALYAAHQVAQTTLTTEIAGINYTLTYPTKYAGVGGLESYTQFLATDSAGNVKCVSSSAYITRGFLLGQYASLDQLISTIGAPNCKWTVASPPLVLVPVLSLTQTETNFEQSPARQTPAAEKAAPSQPIIVPTVTPTSSAEVSPRETPPALPTSSIVDSNPTKPDAPPRTTLPVEPSSPAIPESPSSNRGSVSDKDLSALSSATISELQPRPTNSQNTEGSIDISIFNSDHNFPESNTPYLPESIVTSIPPAGGNEEPGKGSSTPRLVLSGQVEARPSPTPQLVLSVGSSVISPDLERNTGSQTSIARASVISPDLERNFGSQTSIARASVTSADLERNFGSQTSIARASVTSADLERNIGGPITIAGTPVSLAPSVSALVFGPTTIIHKTKSGALVFGTQVLVPDRNGGYIFESRTLFPGRAPITIKGTALSLAPSASELIIGSKTLTAIPVPNLPPVVVVHQVSVQSNTKSELLIAGQTLVPGAPPISIDGQPVSLAPGESQFVIGSSTKTLSSIESGLASLILQGFSKIGSDPIPTRPRSNTTTSPTLAVQYAGGAGLGRYTIKTTCIGISVLLMGLGTMI